MLVKMLRKTIIFRTSARSTSTLIYMFFDPYLCSKDPCIDGFLKTTPKLKLKWSSKTFYHISMISVDKIEGKICQIVLGELQQMARKGPSRPSGESLPIVQICKK
ncbi:hypothetical protein L1049_018321 [Liquidambar formosana]|uniref:Uncharacterized protein n=1 Tax=Liquidambar formosana TaxID=63359 RepID=A0AAP0R9Z2_LIQFO